RCGHVADEVVRHGVQVGRIGGLHQSGEGGDGVVEVRPGGLDQPVRVQDEHAAGRQRELQRRVVGVRLDAQQQTGRDTEQFGPSGRVPQQGRRVPGGGQADAAAGEVEVGVETAGDQVGVGVGEQAVGARQDGAWGSAESGVDVDGGAHLTHEGGSANFVALYV